MDNGSPWGVTHTPGAYSGLTAWLMRLGTRVTDGGPYHPQTQGKDERFHRTSKLEVISRGPLDDPAHAQRRFDAWRDPYDHERPHESLGMAVPASRYRVSPRAFPDALPAVEYAPGVEVRKVNPVGQSSFRRAAVEGERGVPWGADRPPPHDHGRAMDDPLLRGDDRVDRHARGGGRGGEPDVLRRAAPPPPGRGRDRRERRHGNGAGMRSKCYPCVRTRATHVSGL